MTLLRSLLAALPAARRRELLLLLLLMLLGGAAELVTLGTVVPFVSGLTGAATQRLHLLPTLPPLAAAMLFVGAVVTASAIRLLLEWESNRTVLEAGHDLDLLVQRRLLAQPYAWHLRHHSSGALAALEKVQVLTFVVLLPSLRALVAFVLAACIVAGLLVISGPLVLVAGVLLALAYGALSLLARRPLTADSRKLGSAYDRRIQLVQESLGGIRDVLIDGSQEQHVEAFRRVDRQIVDARLRVTLLGTAPRFLIEPLGILLLAAVAVLFSSRQGGLGAALPALGALALGAQRLLPLLQQIYGAVAAVGGHWQFAADVVGLLALPDHAAARPEQPLPFRTALRLEDIGFAYEGCTEAAIDGVMLTIPVGSRTALVGRSGSGKSTLADLIMGLLTPDIGTMSADGVRIGPALLPAWQANIAHVPQSVFLFDASLAANVAMAGLDHPIDRAAVMRALEQAQLGPWLATLPDGLDTFAGEQGVRLSGGQRQRIGLARAIYKQAPLLILDEPTSALDAETEEAVIRVLDSLQAEGRTILIISHRPGSVAGCDQVIRLEHGCIA
ncbi:ABC transporter ATP-binding protein [Sphingomonas ginkgonis]|uniref:ABC transporter ATP-binding protein n=1 Tax=Sphingomonas ginkgonis TaxID=2315330 RepID=A0A429V9Z9_9SPHN|nr:ABC transporter ATP-binding protein [Sphingomonas ginkgonis]RST30813.1 ABC transporter ATP-binding protein [Sphingomonas ginkgonis]